MGRKNAANIKKHNDKLNKELAKNKTKKTAREEKLKAILRKFNDSKE